MLEALCIDICSEIRHLEAVSPEELNIPHVLRVDFSAVHYQNLRQDLCENIAVLQGFICKQILEVWHLLPANGMEKDIHDSIVKWRDGK